METRTFEPRQRVIRRINQNEISHEQVVAMGLSDTVSLSVSERRHKKGTCRFVQVPRSL